MDHFKRFFEDNSSVLIWFVAIVLPYIIIFIVGLFQFLPILLGRYSEQTTYRIRLFACFFLIQNIYRAVSNFLLYYYPESRYVDFFGIKLNDILFVSIFMVLLLWWSDAYHLSLNPTEQLLFGKKTRKRFLDIVLGFLVVLALAITAVVHFITPEDNGAIGVIAGIYLFPVAATLIFFVYQYYIFRGQIRQTRRGSALSLRVVGGTTIFVAFMFLCRATFDFVSLKHTELQVNKLYFIFVFFLFGEMIPLVLMLRLPRILLHRDEFSISDSLNSEEPPRYFDSSNPSNPLLSQQQPNTRY